MKNTLLLFVILIASTIFSVNVVGQTYVANQIYETDYINPPSAPASITIDKSEIIAPPSWASTFSSCVHTTGSAGLATLNFGTALNLVSNGTNEGTITVYWGAGSNRPINLTLNGGTATKIDEITSSADRNTVRTATYAIPIGTTSISSIKLNGSGGGDSYYFQIKVETWQLAGPRIETFALAISSDPLETKYFADDINVDGSGVGHIHVVVPYSVWRDNITNLYPTITTNAITTFVTPADPTAPQNFTSPFTYSLTGGGTNRDYIVTVDKTPASTVKKITYFKILNSVGVINEVAKTINVTVPFSSVLPGSYAVDNIAISDGFATLLTTGAQSFTEGVPTTYTVRAEDLSTQNYAVTLTKAPASTACNITNFSMGVPIEEVDINNGAGTITVKVAGADNITNVTPIYSVSNLATLTSPSFPQNFTTPKTLVVTAESGATKSYTVTVTKDGTAPVFVSSNPQHDPTYSNSVGSLAGLITLTYDEDVVAGTGSAVTISGGGTLQAPTYVGKTVQIPFSGLTSLTNYTLTIPVNAFADKFGNGVAARTINFRTADGENKIFPYASKMDGSAFALPAFISGGNYNATADSKATTTTQYGAYVLAPGEKLTITSSKVGTVLANVYAPGENRSFTISNNQNATVSNGNITTYDNNGTEISQTINSNVVTEIYITNTSVSGNIYIPYIYISDVNQPAVDEKTQWCK